MPGILSVIKAIPLGGGVLRMTWNDCVTRDVDLRGQMQGPAVLGFLTVPEVFRDASVVPGGGGVQWVNGADFSARSLRIWSEEQENLNARKVS